MVNASQAGCCPRWQGLPSRPAIRTLHASRQCKHAAHQMPSPPQPLVLTYDSTPVQGATGSTRKWSGRGALGGCAESFVLQEIPGCRWCNCEALHISMALITRCTGRQGISRLQAATMPFDIGSHPE